ncbi:MAG: hypothetical protein QMC74_01475 [Myxococcota bacterium]|jgi:hypothetical protein
MRDRPRVGEILVSAGIIDEMQLTAALAEQSRWGKRLGVTLIKMGMVEEGHLIRALAKQLDLPVASLAGKRILPEVIALVPARLASKHGVIPLFLKDDGPNGQLYLGMEDPSDLAVLDDLCFRTGIEIRPVMVGPSELGEAIERYYHGRDGSTPQADPFRTGEPMSPASLRVVTDASSQPGNAPAEPITSIEQEIAQPLSRARQVEFKQEPAQVTAQPAAEPESTPPTRPSPAPKRVEAAPLVAAPIAKLPDGLLDDVARSVEETEKTRIVTKAITQLLIEKGLISLEELQVQIASLKAQGSHTGAGENSFSN